MKALKQPSLRLNTLTNFIALSYTTSISIIVFPFFLQYLGAEAFGLIGFFVVFQAWMQLLDAGISPMLSRQVALARSKTETFFELKQLLRTLEVIFVVVASIGAVVVFLASHWIAASWLNVITLAANDVALCIGLMGCMVGLRFFSSLYRSGVRGMEDQVRLNIVNVILASLKSLGALLVLEYLAQDIIMFFVYQLAIIIIELFVLKILFYSRLPATESVKGIFFWKNLKANIPFAGGIAYTAIIWVLLTQLDKLILSSTLTLSDYGYFSLVVVIATGITQLSSPITQAILPRMAYLLSQQNEHLMLNLYKKSTQFMAVIIFPLSGIIALFSKELIYGWTGNQEAAEWAAPILYWFALGNGLLAITAFQYYLQFAHGKLKMHVVFNTVWTLIQLPLIIFVVYQYGAIGAAFMWFILRGLEFALWVPVVHAKFAPTLHWNWLFKDVIPILISTMVVLLLFKQLTIECYEINRWVLLGNLAIIAVTSLVVNVATSSACRKIMISKYRQRKRPTLIQSE